MNSQVNQEVKHPLNAGQQAAADGFFRFLLGPEREMGISGPAGVGKTFVMGHLIDRVMPKYLEMCQTMGIPAEYDAVIMTAVTNKAADVLAQATNRATTTIHSFLNLKVYDDFSTGRSKLTKTREWRVYERMIIFIDEAYAGIDSHLYTLLQEATHKCKIVYVGDDCQLAPVGENSSILTRKGFPIYELTEPVRNAEQPALMEVSDQLRATVKTNVFKPIQIVPGVIDWLGDEEMQHELFEKFLGQNAECRILAYTNDQVIRYNDHIRTMRNMPDAYQKGEILVNNSAIRIGREMLSAEEVVTVMDLDMGRIEDFKISEFDDESPVIKCRYATLKSRLGNYYSTMLPVDRYHYLDLLKYYSKHKLWPQYFKIKNKFADLRARDAATVHKSQGSTYHTVFIDVGNLSTCHNPAVVKRLLYVGFTRAKSRVVLYGDLSAKYGGLVR